MNWSDITSGYGSQSFRPIGGLLGLNLGNMQQQLPPQFAQLFGNSGMQQFPQYGGNTRSAQMMNSYMGGLLSRRQGYMPPQMPARQQPAAAASASPNAGSFYFNANNGNWWDAVPGASGPAGNAGPA